MEHPVELTEITTDNHTLLGAAADDIGYIAVRRPGSADGDRPEVHRDLAEALDSLRTALAPIVPDVGEALPIGSGRRWLTTPDPDETDSP